MKKTREQWGSWEDWMAFEQDTIHEEWCGEGFYCASFANVLSIGRSEKVEEARRLAVEKYCGRNGVTLPWRPDFDLSTENGCREAIKECGYTVDAQRASIQLEDATRFKIIVFPLALEQWQEAAQFAIDNHEQ